jgi:hypothetical protein
MLLRAAKRRRKKSKLFVRKNIVVVQKPAAMLKEKETPNNFEATRMVSSLLIRPDRGSSRVKLTKKKTK